MTSAHHKGWPRDSYTGQGGGLYRGRGGGMYTGLGGGASTLRGGGLSTLRGGGLSTLPVEEGSPPCEAAACPSSAEEAYPP